MTPKQIQRRLSTISKKRNHWQAELDKLQNVCQHPTPDKKHKGNTGNYDPTADCYWIEYRCHDCDKRWIVEQ